ncbi:MAG TPA: glycosyltransferase [Sphingobium sp.]|nr:glycosyltransferase [Sphingobium sp.]
MMAALDLDILDLPDRIAEADTCEGALILLRIAGRPCGQAVLSFRNWSHEQPVLERILAGADSAFWEAWLAYRLGVNADGEGDAPTFSTDVVICTRDRADDLRKCLSDLMAMPQDGQRYLVVDNASATDATRQVVEAFPGVVYVREDRPGLDIARNTGIRATHGDVIAFIDDDAAPDPLWLRKLSRNFAHPAVMAAGGLTMAMELETGAQIAFQRMGGFGRGFKRVIYDSSNCYAFNAWCAGAGVNMALRREVVARVGWFDEALDAGTRSLAGGDADYFRRIINAGWRIVYDPEALNWHRHRRTMKELERQVYGYEVSAFAILAKAVIHERDPRAVAAVLHWLRMRAPQLAHLVGRKPGWLSFNPLITQVKGAMAGPGRYSAARRELRHAD